MNLIDKFQELKDAFVQRNNQLPHAIVVRSDVVDEVLYSEPFSKYLKIGAGYGEDRSQLFQSRQIKDEFKFVTFHDTLHDEPIKHANKELYFGWDVGDKVSKYFK